MSFGWLEIQLICSFVYKRLDKTFSSNPVWCHNSHGNSQASANSRNKDPRWLLISYVSLCWIKYRIQHWLVLHTLGCKSTQYWSILFPSFQSEKKDCHCPNTCKVLKLRQKCVWKCRSVSGSQTFGDHWHLRYRKDCHEELFFHFPLRSHHRIFLKYEI